MSLADYQDKFKRLIVNMSGGRASPHKLCMLLAVLDLARAGGLSENRIPYAPPLLERYNRFFAAVKAPGDHPNPYFPFFHLAGKLRGGGASFWHLTPLPGREAVLAAMTTARSPTDTGVRILLPTGEAMVEAAHIHPFSEAGDDDPRNGLALTPNMHWAMDRNLIAPGPDLKWHVSPVLDDRVPDVAMLVNLEGKALILPTQARFAPKREALEWRIENLRRRFD